MSINRRAFFGRLAGVATFGVATVHANAGAVFGHATPHRFPEFNWIDLPTPVSEAVMPYRGDYLVGGHEGIYRISGIRGPFKVSTDNRGCPCRVWAMEIDPAIARVELWTR